MRFVADKFVVPFGMLYLLQTRIFIGFAGN
jgi:hypothetical protein